MTDIYESYKIKSSVLKSNRDHTINDRKTYLLIAKNAMLSKLVPQETKHAEPRNMQKLSLFS